MYLTTLCYIKYQDYYLMMHRTKKKNDPSQDKWIGVGGKFEADESPEECLCREAYEETGLTLTSYTYRGLVTFVSDKWETEYMHLYTAEEFEGDIILPNTEEAVTELYTTQDGRVIPTISSGIPCNEGILKWIKCDDVYHLKLWEGDKIFLKMLEENRKFFSLKLKYQGEDLKYIACDGVVCRSVR
jgi:8-oxo-dGTP diphosphatase